MKVIKHYLVGLFVFPLLITGCIGAGGSAPGQNTVMVSEVISICGALVGVQAEQRINSEWEKYPEMDVSRPMIESMAQVLLQNPESGSEQGALEYSKYISCATGLLMAKGF